jgi:hypothetical protein
MRQLKVTLRAAGVKAHKWLPLLLSLRCGHLRLASNLHLSVLLVPHLWDDESGMSGHCHLDGSCTLVHVSIGRDASRGICYDLEW